MKAKQTNNRKAAPKAAKEPAVKKTAAGKTPATAAARKPAAASRAQSAPPALPEVPDVKRPPSNNPNVPETVLDFIRNYLNYSRAQLEEYSAHLRPLDRRRLNSVGIRNRGFIESAYALAMENQNFLPQFLPIEKFQEDYNYFFTLRALFDMCTQVRELLWNLTIQASDMVYTDSLEFYVTVREAGKRRVDGAESIYRELERFFKRGKMVTEEPTEDELKKEALALLDKRHEGKLIIQNIKPKLIAGKRTVIEEEINDVEKYKETSEGEIVR